MKSLKRDLTQRLTRLLALVIVTGSFALQAQPVGNSEAASNIANWKGWKTVGEAHLTWFIFDIYHSRLKAPDGKFIVSDDVSPHPLALEINYKRDISKQQLLDVTDEQWAKLGFTDSYRKAWISELDRMFPDIQKGDELTYLTDGKSGQLFYKQVGDVQVKNVGIIEDERMNDAFLAIWLSPNTEFPKLRKQLIGQVR
ncbi:chalcone isomerase family protein [Vibrio sp. Vb2960]|uniref:chalcone isomerase family protein n=1 Tax=Vibrio sp. Vb2960 TaxID=3074693 RepID=UPI00296539C7|nr:chalcone isomerase family protein [Vibrio sp. Vb2960]MDW1602037.1 chalcone isomerase family protein [Vibrio sp. Vb2960]